MSVVVEAGKYRWRSGVQGHLLLHREFEVSLACIRAEERRKEERGKKRVDGKRGKGEERKEEGNEISPL